MEFGGYIMVDKPTILQIFGCLMQHPQYLSESDKYNLTPDDFSSTFEKQIFGAIYNLYLNKIETPKETIKITAPRRRQKRDEYCLEDI